MTDLVKLVKEKQYPRIEWQPIPVDMTIDDLNKALVAAIEYFYMMAGKSAQYSDDLVIKDEEDVPIFFNADFELDERMFIIQTALVMFYEKAQTNLSEEKGYTTDAMAVTNAEKPFKNVGEIVEREKKEQTRIWHKMSRYNIL